MRLSKLWLISLLLIFCFINSQAQQNVSELVEKAFANSEKVSSVKQEIVTNLITIDEKVDVINAKQEIKQSKCLRFNKTKANELIARNSETLSIQVFDDFGKPLVLDLINTRSFFENLKITTGSNKTINLIDIKSTYYAGVVRGIEKASLVSISIFENELVGIVAITGYGNLTIGKIIDSESHVVYIDNSPLENNDFSCLIYTNANNGDSLNNNVSLNANNNASNNKCLKIFYETTFDIFENKGSIVDVTAYVTGLHNFVATLYLNEGINTPLSAIKIWDILDPFFPLSFFNYKNIRTTFNGDIGHLLTYRLDVSGQYGGAGVFPDTNLCERPQNQKLSFSKLRITPINNLPIYAYNVFVITHELGHTLGSNHTFQCVWNGNNTPIDGCYNYGTTYFPYCPSVIIPPANIGGTIMSYCTRTTAGVNFNNGFGAQPGDLIRNTIKLSTCLETCQTCLSNLNINTITTTSKFIQVSNNITNNSSINDNLNINYRANNIIFQPGFNVRANFYSSFIAAVDQCTDILLTRNQNTTFGSNKNVQLNTTNNDSAIVRLEVFPNPFKEIVNIQVLNNEIKNIKIATTEGKIIYNIQNVKTDNYNFETEILPSGVYLLNIETTNGTFFNKKIIKN